VLDSLGVSGQELLGDRDEIPERLKIERLPVAPLAPASLADRPISPYTPGVSQ
jgi:hypothetical protein